MWNFLPLLPVRCIPTFTCLFSCIFLFDDLNKILERRGGAGKIFLQMFCQLRVCTAEAKGIGY